MEEILSDIGSTPALEPVTDDSIVDLITSAHAQSIQQEPDQQQHHGEGLVDSDVESAPAKAPAKVHSCGFCGSVFKSYPALVEHRATHGGSRPYECHVCDKRFTQKAHLIIHRRTHTGEKPYACHICHKRFSQTSHLNSHKRVHTGEKPFFCSLCSMGFCRRQRLEVHLQQHAREMQQGLARNSQSEDRRLAGLSGSNAKDLLMSMGLGTDGSIKEPSVEDVDSVTGKDISAAGSSMTSQGATTTQMAVFPEFSLEGEVENRANVSDHNSLDGENIRGSRSPDLSQSSSVTSTGPVSKSRRKPAFVRKLGYSQLVKVENTDELSINSDRTDEKIASTDTMRVQMSAQEAAVKAMLRMATGSDSDDIGDLSALSDVAGLDASISGMLLKQSLQGVAGSSLSARCTGKFPSDQCASLGRSSASRSASSHSSSNAILSSLIRTNNRVSLVDFTAEDLLRHLMSRDDAYRCDFCCIIFHDAAMYHLHRSMHDKMDIRCCNLCGKLLTDKYDFTAHFLSQHK